MKMGVVALVGCTMVAAAIAGGLPDNKPEPALPLPECKSEKSLEAGPCVVLPEETSLRESHYREANEGDWGRKPRALGVALSGGGSKSAPFALGVLAGLHDEDLLLPAPGACGRPQDVIVSSVSGGGYAAYHLFTQLSWFRAHGTPAAAGLKGAYADCLRHVPEKASGELREKLLALACRKPQANQPLPFGEQYKLRCAQDIFQPGECSLQEGVVDGVTTYSRDSLIVVPTLLSLPVHHALNSVFDTGINLSPSQEIYRSGIGVTYGSVSLPGDSAPGPRPYMLNCTSGEPVMAGGTGVTPSIGRCAVVPTFEDAPGPGPRALLRSVYVKPVDLSFDELRSLRQDKASGNAPLWVIQATASKYRSLGGWAAGYDRDLDLDTFEFTSFGFGSRRYGFYPAHLPNVSVLDATVSAAAFFDANQQKYVGPVVKTAAGLALHGFNLNWGIDIPNYTVPAWRSAVHRTLPFPLYWLDSLLAQFGETPARADRKRSVFIRLMDGGNADNTGLMALIRRGVRTAVYADAAEDAHGNFENLCVLRLHLHTRPLRPVGHELERLTLHIPGLKGFGDDCNEKAWDVFAEWKHQLPVLAACITRGGADCDGNDVVMRLVIVKPRVEWKLEGGAQGNGFMNSVRWDEEKGEARQCVQAGLLLPGGEDCYGKADSACIQALPCEVVNLYLGSRDSVTAKRPASSFPQTDTVWTTANSTPTLYAASRDLARHYTRLAGNVIRDAIENEGRGAFRTLWKQQEAQQAAMTQPAPAVAR
jgi:hypothetical protein